MPTTPMSTYQGQKVALLTQHGKETVIAPVLSPVLGCVIEHVTGFDTDQLGTFTRELPRPGTQLEAARLKARKGMELSGLSIGMASEGSFGPDPFTAMFPWNIEMLVWIDDSQGLEVMGMAQGAVRSGHVQTGSWSEVESFALGEDFPHHQLVLRPQGQDDGRFCKGIDNWEQLKSCFNDCAAQSTKGQVFVETDLRAFANPTRMQNIEKAARDLLQRLEFCCPACSAPGYGVTGRQPGLPCSACGQPTSSYLNTVWACVRCQHTAVQPRTDRVTADPKDCARCNP